MAISHMRRFRLVMLFSVVLVLVASYLPAHSGATPIQGSVTASGDASATRATLELLSNIGGDIAALAVDDGIAYIGEGHSLSIVDVHNPAAPVWLASVPMPQQISAIYIHDGLVFAQYNDILEANAIQLVDVRDPARPHLLDAIDGVPAITQFQVVGTLVYLASYTDLWIFDASNPAMVRLRSRYTAPGVIASMQIVGDLAYLLLYIGYQGIHVVDVVDPANPALRGQYEVTSDPVAYPSSIQVVGDLALVGVNHEGLVIIDLTDPSAPHERARLPIANFQIDWVQVVGALAYIGYSDPASADHISNPQLGGPFPGPPHVAAVDVSDLSNQYCGASCR
jgi:hypothetical protein